MTTGDWSACEMCALPVDDHRLCVQCLTHRRSGLPLADRAGFLVYADEPSSQTYRALRGYKEPRTNSVFEPTVRALLAIGLRAHFTCANMLAGTADSGWAVVPSTKNRTTLTDLVRGLARTPQSEVRARLVGSGPGRALKPGAWGIEPGGRPPSHVVVIDDAWVSGASSQSLAALLKQSGVGQVSILAVGRVLSPQWDPNKAFLTKVLPTIPYDWTVCPWTLAACPA
ncbi:hypothetical protein [Cryptosporangium sp. NPDC051539]|uniref:hypothetical protein n=1 Tax=Cryptosporangium sp. NPDC051539 TaxID=3363962 RepID=UPI0037872762